MAGIDTNNDNSVHNIDKSVWFKLQNNLFSVSYSCSGGRLIADDNECMNVTR